MANKVEYDVELDLKEFRKDLKAVEASFLKSSKDMTKKANSAGSVFKGMLGAEAVKKGMTIAVNAVKDGLTAIVEETGQLEAATVKWEVMLGSAEAAGDKIKEIFEFSNRTPFTFKGVEKAANTLYSLTDGALSGMDAIENLGDRAAKAGIGIDELSVQYGRLYSNMTSGRAMGEQLARMQELGILSGKARGELEKLSKTDMMNGKGWSTFLESTSQANGMMEKLSGTINGKISTLTGVWDGIFAFEDDDVQQSIKDSLDFMINTLNSNKPQIQEILADIFSITTNYVSEWVDGAKEIKDLYDKATNQVGVNAFGDAKATTAKGVTANLLNADKSAMTEYLNRQKEQYKIENESSQILKANLSNFVFANGRGERVLLNGSESLDYLLEMLEDQQGQFSTAVRSGLGMGKEANLLELETTVKALKEAVLTKTRIDSINASINSANAKTLSSALDKDKADATSLKTKLDEEAGYTKVDLAYMIEQMGFDPSISAGIKNDVGTNIPFKLGTEQNADAFRDVSLRLIEGREALANLGFKIYDLTEATIEANKVEVGEGVARNAESLTNQLVAIHQNWSDNSLKNFAGLNKLLIQNTSNILQDLQGTGAVGGLGNLIPGLGIAAAGFGIISTLAGVFGSDDNEDSVDYSTASSSSSNKANIVSNGPENLYITNNFTITAGYIGDQVGTAEFFEEEISPRIESATIGVL